MGVPNRVFLFDILALSNDNESHEATRNLFIDLFESECISILGFGVVQDVRKAAQWLNICGTARKVIYAMKQASMLWSDL